MSFIKDKIFLEIKFNDLKLENEKLLKDNKRMRKLIDYLVVSYILTILCFLILIKQLGL